MATNESKPIVYSRPCTISFDIQGFKIWGQYWEPPKFKEDGSYTLDFIVIGSQGPSHQRPPLDTGVWYTLDNKQWSISERHSQLVI